MSLSRSKRDCRQSTVGRYWDTNRRLQVAVWKRSESNGTDGMDGTTSDFLDTEDMVMVMAPLKESDVGIIHAPNN